MVDKLCNVKIIMEHRNYINDYTWCGSKIWINFQNIFY